MQNTPRTRSRQDPEYSVKLEEISVGEGMKGSCSLGRRLQLL